METEVGLVDRRSSEKIREFVSYEHFVEYMEGLIKGLPSSIYSLVNLFNNNPQLIHEFLKYLFTPASPTS